LIKKQNRKERCNRDRLMAIGRNETIVNVCKEKDKSFTIKTWRKNKNKKSSVSFEF
jgi:hypothetical protein